MYIVIIDGIIGSGKSTLIRKLKDTYFKNVMYVEEPVEEFMKFFVGDVFYDPLKLQYENIDDNCIATQIHIIMAIEKHFRKLFIEAEYKSVNILVVERSLFSPLGFIKTLAKYCKIEQFMASILYELAMSSFKRLDQEFNICHNVVFLLTPPIFDCLSNIKHRNRICEEAIDFDYLELLQTELLNIYNQWNIPTVVCESIDEAYKKISLRVRFLKDFGKKC